MSQTKRNQLDLIEDEPPSKKLISDGDVLISELVKKQTKRITTLQEQLAVHQTFTKSSHISDVHSIKGSNTLQNFQEAVIHNNQVEQLKAAGLSDCDVKLYSERSRSKIEPNVLSEKLSSIEKLLKNKSETNEIAGTSSKKFEEQLTIKPNSIETKLLKFALDNQKCRERLPHPLDNIKQIETNCFGSLNESNQSIVKIRRKARKLSKRVERSRLVEKPPVVVVQGEIQSLARQTLWDVREEQKEPNLTSKIYTCKPQNYYTIRNGEIVKLENGKIPKDKERISVEEIRNLPKFNQYDVGEPSPILYLKNLSKGVNCEQLQSIFKDFNKEIEDIRIMSGKMRGSSFITFNSVDKAKEALEAINGTVIDGRPIVIQFGRKTT